ncbi:MAG: glycosyltransferase, partial [Candidatus Amulumruptor sp.]|nr:glycosyltransferase [Candidatus Amulumruptor sp.]
ERASRSLLWRDREVEVIPNAFPAEYYSPDEIKGSADPLAEVGANDLRIVMCAARLDDTIKGLPYAIEALNYIFDNEPELARRMTVVFVGEIHNPAALDGLRMPYVALGRVNDTSILRLIYGHSHIVLSTSLYETLPGTLIEGQAMGCIPVTFGRGGQADIVNHKVNGYIAEYKDTHSVAEGIIWAINSGISRDELHDSVVKRFSSPAIAARYIELFGELLAGGSDKPS